MRDGHAIGVVTWAVTSTHDLRERFIAVFNIVPNHQALHKTWMGTITDMPLVCPLFALDGGALCCGHRTSYEGA
jgi:hypothetical protein